MGQVNALRHLCIACLVVLAAGCATAPKPLYSWEDFQRRQYEILLRDGVDLNAQLKQMQEHAVKARAAGDALPPGFRAHLGLLHFGLGNIDLARSSWAEEITAFPESAPYIEQLVRRAQPAPSETVGKEPS